MITPKCRLSFVFACFCITKPLLIRIPLVECIYMIHGNGIMLTSQSEKSIEHVQ